MSGMTEAKREYMRAFYRQPEQKEKKSIRSKAYRQRPEIKAKHREYMKAWSQKPENNEALRLMRKRPDIQTRDRANRARPEYKAWAREYHLRKAYGLTMQDFNAMLTAQCSRCAVCGSFDWGHKGPVVDHNHTTGAVRGIVCHQCNVAIGFVRDDPNRARAVADYLQKKEHA